MVDISSNDIYCNAGRCILSDRIAYGTAHLLAQMYYRKPSNNFVDGLRFYTK